MLRSDDVYDEILRNHLLSYSDHMKPVYEISHRATGHNIDCCDKITVHMCKRNDVIHDLYFHGKCCPIVKASASLMVEELKGKTQNDAIYLAKRTRLLTSNLLREDGLFDTLIKQLCKSSAFKKNKSGLVRCVLLPWETMIDATNRHVTLNHSEDRDYSLYLE